MKKIGILLSLTVLATSCHKDLKLDPVTGYNSQLKFDNLQLYNAIIADSIKAFVDFRFLVTNDTSVNLDTVQFQHSFKIVEVSGNQLIHFNTPAKTKTASFKVQINIYGGSADSVHVDHFSYLKDDNTLFYRPLYFDNQGDLFTAPTVSYIF